MEEVREVGVEVEEVEAEEAEEVELEVEVVEAEEAEETYLRGSPTIESLKHSSYVDCPRRGSNV